MSEFIAGGTKRGFSLLELVIVMMLISVLAVTVAPKMFNSSGYDELSYQQRLIALLRLQQTKAMQASNDVCYRVLITGTRFGITYDGSDIDCTSNALPSDYSNINMQDYSHYGLSIDELADGISFSSHDIYFNHLGCPTSAPVANVALPCSTSSVQIAINGLETHLLCIESQGYIHTGACD